MNNLRRWRRRIGRGRAAYYLRPTSAHREPDSGTSRVDPALLRRQSPHPEHRRDCYYGGQLGCSRRGMFQERRVERVGGFQSKRPRCGTGVASADGDQGVEKPWTKGSGRNRA